MFNNIDALPLGKLLQPKQGSGKIKKLKKKIPPPSK
jgi:hypothetical protein